MIRSLSLVTCVFLGVACATGAGDSPVGDDTDAARVDAASTPVRDGAAVDSASPPVDARDIDAPSGSSLDPDLDPADPSGAVCTTPGSLGECPLTEVCRFYDTETGRCETCGPCGNLNADCNASSECDILFMCYQGKCTNFCTLGTSECGPIDDCIDVGHATKGVCRPF